MASPQLDTGPGDFSSGGSQEEAFLEWGPVTLEFSSHWIQQLLSTTSSMIAGDITWLNPPLKANFLWGIFISKVLVIIEGRVRKPW